MTHRTLLIDADVLAYQSASAVEVAWEVEDDFWIWYCNAEEVRSSIEDRIYDAMERLKADKYFLCLTDSERNFRYDILPTYKGNRKLTKKPLVLKAIRQWMIDEHEAMLKPGLEGDDVMGILATWDKLKGEKIIVSIDKDMKTIPGLYCRDLETGVVEITEAEADYWHLVQTLSGDVTDGYAGCPTVGHDRACKALSDMTVTVPYTHTFKTGKRAGEAEVRWAEEPTDDPWKVVVSRYEKAGLNETSALQQARVARILRASDYDFQKKEPILWTP